jgi:hypothetical protein
MERTIIERKRQGRIGAKALRAIEKRREKM